MIDLLMNDELNPRSLAFQLNDLLEHCEQLSRTPSGAGWPTVKQKRVEEAASRMLNADVALICIPVEGNVRPDLDDLLLGALATLPDFSDAITHTFFSHAEMERVP